MSALAKFLISKTPIKFSTFMHLYSPCVAMYHHNYSAALKELHSLLTCNNTLPLFMDLSYPLIPMPAALYSYNISELLKILTNNNIASPDGTFYMDAIYTYYLLRDKEKLNA